MAEREFCDFENRDLVTSKALGVDKKVTQLSRISISIVTILFPNLFKLTISDNGRT